MPKGLNTAGHPNRIVHRERFTPSTSKEVEVWTDPNTWSEDRLDEWAASPMVTEREGWLRTHNSLF